MLLRFAARLLAALALSSIALSAGATGIWFVDDDKLYLVNPLTNAVDRSIDVDGVLALASTVDGSAWVLSKKRLALYQATGAVAVDVSLKSLSLAGSDRIALDSRDGSLWLAEGKDDDGQESGKGSTSRIVRLDANGLLNQDFSIPDTVRSLAVALDQTLWILGDENLWHFTASGTLIARIKLDQLIRATPSLLAVDSIGAWLWMAEEKQIWRLEGATQKPSVFKITLNKAAEAISLDPRSGDIWVLADSAILAFGQNGNLKQSISLKSQGVKDPKLLVFDPVNGAIWVSHDNSLSRFNLDGLRVSTLAMKKDVNAIAEPPMTLSPTIEIVSPTVGSVTENPVPTFRLSFGANCGELSCGFGVDYFRTYKLSATLNGEDVSSQFTMRPDMPQAVFTPTRRLPEGKNVFSALVADSFGRVTPTLAAQFFVDTLPPTIASLSPPDGAVLSTPLLTISGSLSEPANIRLVGNQAQHSTVAVTFTFPVTLMEGLNQFTLTAKDAAGNESVRHVSYTLDTTPPVLADMISDNGFLTDSPTFIVTGSSDEVARFTLSKDGVSQTAEGKSFSFTVALAVGLNVFRLAATDAAGNTTIKDVKLTRRDPGISATLSSPSSGSIYSAPATIRLVVETFSQASEIQRVEFLKDGVVVASGKSRPFEYQLALPVPGSFSLSATAFSDSGAIAQSGDVRVHVFDTPERATRAVWDRFRAAIAGGDQVGASSYLASANRARYQSVLGDLGSIAASVLSSLSVLTLVSVEDDFVEYFVTQRDESTNRDQGFFIYLVRESDGVWRILEM